MKRFFLLFSLLSLISCASVDRAEFGQAHAAPLYFTGMQVLLPTGADVGSLTTSARGCLWPYESAGKSIIRGAVDRTDQERIFADTLEALGYDVVGSMNDYYFDEELQNELMRTEYKIGARLTNIETAACYQDSEAGFFSIRSEGYKGEMRATFEWSVFDNLNKSTVYKTESVGYARRKRVNEEGLTLLLNDAFEMAVHNLAADKRFYDLLVRGIEPVDNGRLRGKDHRERPRKFDPDERVTVPDKSLYQAPLNIGNGRLQRTTVLVQAGRGHGSGFFITRDGHILTNAHVVGSARRVRIVTSAKADKLTAEVLRTDKVRDVALLKLENVPPELTIDTFPVRFHWPDVGESVYVAGAPRTTRLQDTVTKGIISAHRRDFRIFGGDVDMLQADVALHGGNSGGPMVDGNGNLVGISVAGFDPTGLSSNAALNLFIPVEEAFAALDIRVD